MVGSNTKIILWSIMFLDAEQFSADWDAINTSFNIYHRDWLMSLTSCTVLLVIVVSKILGMKKRV